MRGKKRKGKERRRGGNFNHPITVNLVSLLALLSTA